VAPRGRSPLEHIEGRTRTAEFDARPGSLAHCIDFLATPAAGIGAGSFVFLLSDFLEQPPAALWLSALTRRWEIVPVVIQDPTWEQSFPAAGPVVLPIVDPDDGAVSQVRLRRSEARAERERRERSRRELLDEISAFGLDPVLVDRADHHGIAEAFLEWAERRRGALWQRR
jgi:hypothetical protein